MRMHEFFAGLLAEGPVVTDGAWGTQLQAFGLPQGHPSDEWNVSNPDRVEMVPRAYVEAGSKIILTNTFQANRLSLKGHGLADRVAEINQAGVVISRRAGGDSTKVFASIGPTGKMIMTEETTEEELLSVFREQATALASAHPDALVLETMSDLAEAKIALAAAKETGLPVVACMVFDSGKDNDRTMMGSTPEQVAEQLSAAGADAVGANCGQGPAGYVDICRRMRAVCDCPIWIKANAGLPQVDGDRVYYNTTPAEFGGYGLALVEAGAQFLGGCCGTNPDFIRSLKKAIQP